MLMRSTVAGLLLCVAALALSGCGLFGGNPTQGIGIATKNCLQDPSVAAPQCLAGSSLTLTPNVPVWGNEFSDYYVNGADQTEGTLGYFGNNGDPPATTGQQGALVVNNAYAPAYWNVFWLEPWPCGTNTNLALGPAYQGIIDYEGVDWYEYESSNTLITNYYPSGATYTLNCYTTGDVLPASTRFAVVGNFPSSITLGGSVPFTTQYGMPIMYVYGGTGSLVATEYATSVSSGGAEATFPFPSGLSEDGYAIAVMNQTSASPGSIPAGVNLLSIAKSTTIAGNPFGVSVGALTNNTDTCISYTLEGRTVTTCTSGSGYETLPIVSLYSTNQVLIGSTAVDVGSNPTAVAAYSAPSVTRKVSGDDVTTTILSSGETRAVVANSGSNSVSVLDIVNDALLYNVTVGNQPVALAVSSDGSTAYVANYKDSTVTKVSLTAGTATETVAVGGKPTSVALTSAGILWVGGVGFLTEINASTMGVTATETVSGKTIVDAGGEFTRHGIGEPRSGKSAYRQPEFRLPRM
jgi:YVTN family beta-propeller protein